MAEETLSARLVEVESMLDRRAGASKKARAWSRSARSARRNPAGADREPAHRIARGQRKAAQTARVARQRQRNAGNALRRTPQCRPGAATDPIDGHPIGITEMEYRVLELLAFTHQCRHLRDALKHLYRCSTTSRPGSSTCSFPSCARNCATRQAWGRFIETIRSAHGSCATSTRPAGPDSRFLSEA